MLLDSAGHSTARTITDNIGRYAFTARALPTTIRAIRIGFSRVGGIDPPDARDLTASDYGAAEYYGDDDSVPTQFKVMGTNCSTWLLWTRYESGSPAG
jgi:hypothetical protein